MKVYIKEWANKTASLLTDNGQVVWTFSSAAEARQACADWHSIIHSGNDELYDDNEEGVSASFSLA
jgi:hypothetical protein